MACDILSVFWDHLEVLPLYTRLEEAILTRVLNVQIRAAKTQVTFSDRRTFAAVSFKPCRKEPPEVWMTVSFCLGCRKESPRIAAAAEASQGGWTHSVMVQSVREIDEELLGWIQEAAVFAATKR